MICGTNGIGVKVANIYSTKFSVEIGDPKAKQLYSQEWTDNMANRQPAKITPYEDDYTYVRVVYELDFARFGYTEGYPPDAVSLFARHAADMAFTSGNNIVFNGQYLSFPNITDYAKLYFGAEVVEWG